MSRYRYTSRQLNVQAKQTFHRIQKQCLDGGEKADYQYKGWDVFVSEGHLMQLVNYDVRQAGEVLKRSHVITL
jgi:hypothetical protein